MNSPLRLAIGFALAATTATSATASFAATTISSAFTRVSPGETVIAPFNVAGGVATTGLYTGLVEVLVSGNGYSFGRSLNDAFYFTPSGIAPSQYYKLGIATQASGLYATEPAREARNLISFINTVGAVAPGTQPAFAANGVYNFVIDLSLVGAAPTKLAFGVSDGYFADNGPDANSPSQYNVQVWQLKAGGITAGGIPEPTTWAMMMIGFGAIGGAMRRRTALRFAVA